MKKLYCKSEISFAISWIVLYCVLQSAANPLNERIGIGYSASAVFCGLQAIVIGFFLKKHGLSQTFGLCKPLFPAKRFLFYLPLILLATRNFWNGFSVNLPPRDLICYLICMPCIGFVEEIIFRGFLFKAMEKNNPKTAIVVSSVTFGIGHLLNLVNGSGAGLAETLFQVSGAIALGFLFVVLFYRGGSLWPCIITHSLINMTSAFANETGFSVERRILFQLILLVIAIAYAVVLTRTLPKPAVSQSDTCGPVSS